jgi:hypothetical protein
MSLNHLGQRSASVLLAGVLLGSSFAAHADEREELEKIRATVLSLIDTLVKNHILPKEKADALMREAENRANVRLAQAPAPDVSADGKKIVRVPYVPEAVKTQMREQIKAEVLAETRNERPGAYEADSWLSRFKFEGDMRLREEFTTLNQTNTPALAYTNMNTNAAFLTRAADVWSTTTTVNGLPTQTFNTQNNVDRARLRMRLGVVATVSDNVTAGLTLSTGSSTSSPTSTNQTMGLGNATNPGFFNKDAVVLDRAYIKYDPLSWLSVSGGRIKNPFFSTDLVWADDLNFEGIAMTVKPDLSSVMSGMPNTFVTAGWFPLTSMVPNQTTKRSLMAFQAGADWQLGTRDNHVKLACSLYDYQGIEGVSQTDAAFTAGSPTYLASEYAAGYRQHGNTLFRINAPAQMAVAGAPQPTWGLASSFRELNLTGTVDIAEFDPVHVLLTGDVVKNIGFNAAQIQARTGSAIIDGNSLGYMGKIQVGASKIQRRGDWNVSVAYRYLGSDAVLDAFTSSDFGLGGTNSKGTILGVNYGIEKNTWLSLRWMSSDLIDSMIPVANGLSAPTKFSTDLIQLDLNTRF